MNIENFQNLDIKDLVLIGGGLFTVVIIIHGFWLAWRSRRAPLRLDITPELIPDEDEDEDDLAYLRGELPNGGGRPMRPLQRGLNFDGVAESSGTAEQLAGASVRRPEHTSPSSGDARTEPVSAPRPRPAVESTVSEWPDAEAESLPGSEAQPQVGPQAETEEAVDVNAHNLSSSRSGEPSDRASAPEVEANSSFGSASDRRPSPWREAAGAPSEWPATESPTGSLDGGMDEKRPAPGAVAASPKLADTERSGGRDDWEQMWDEGFESVGETEHRHDLADERSRETEQIGEVRAACEELQPDDLLIISLFAPGDSAYTGEILLGALRNQGLKYGDRKIFHRLDPTTRAIRYSVANVLEPGHFDMGSVDKMLSPGLVFFMRLGDAEDPNETVEDLIDTSAAIAGELGAELKDENMAALTPQRMHTMRERVAEYSRRQPSRRVGAM